MTCPHCGKKLLQVAADGRVKLRTAVVLLDGPLVKVACRGCGHDIELPVTPKPELLAAVTKAQQGPKLVVVKGS